MAMGPFRAGDLTGGRVVGVRKRRYVEVPGVVYSRLPDRLCELGRFGQKTGAGYYRYEPGAGKASRTTLSAHWWRLLRGDRPGPQADLRRGDRLALHACARQ